MQVREERGYTLVELVIVTTVLAIVAAIAVPGSTSGPDKQLDHAAEEFAAAMRFARSEAMRTRQAHGFDEQSGNNQILVFRLDTGTSPATLIYDVYHPLDKSIYDIDLDLQSLAAADSITRNAAYRGTCNQEHQVIFDSTGTPWCSDPTSVLLDSYELTFVSGSEQRIVRLDGVTGRVSSQ